MSDDESAPAATEAEEAQVEEEVEETEAGEAAPVEEAAPKEPEPPPPPQRIKLKIRGTEKELSLDEVQELANRGDYFDRSRKEVESARFVMKQFEQDPVGAAIQVFHNKLGNREQAESEVRQIVERYLGEGLAYEHASEEERQRIDIERENQRLRAIEASRVAQERQARETAEWNTFTDRVEKALLAEGVELDDEVIDDLFSVWNRAVDLEEENLDVAEVARRTKAQTEKRSARNLEKLMKDPAKLAARAPALKEQVRKDDIEQLRAAQRSKRLPGTSARGAPRETPPKRRPAISMADLDQELSRY